MRDIVVVRDDPARQQQIVGRVRDEFDAVLVHGDPEFIPLDASFPAAPQIAARLVYTGYVGPPAEPLGGAPSAPGGEVIVSGAAGLALLAAALAARRQGCLADLQWRLLTGANLPEDEFAALSRDAPAGVTVERFRHDFRTLLRGCRLSVSQAGYNTVLDFLAASARAVLVPFAAERETEQLLRAERLAALGAAEMVRESELSADSLARAVERAAARDPAKIAIDIDGASRSARLIAGMIGGAGAAPDLAAGLSRGTIGQ